MSLITKYRKTALIEFHPKPNDSKLTLRFTEAPTPDLEAQLEAYLRSCKAMYLNEEPSVLQLSFKGVPYQPATQSVVRTICLHNALWLDAIAACLEEILQEDEWLTRRISLEWCELN